jgi:uncharacterized protein involved in outer membrane biogenesis
MPAPPRLSALSDMHACRFLMGTRAVQGHHRIMLDASRSFRRGWLITAAMLLLLGVLVWAFSVPWKLNWMRGWVGERVEQSTGRVLVIDGDLWWRWGWPSRLQANELRFANPPWAGRPQMLTLKSLDAQIELLPLLRHRLVLPEVRAEQPDLWLEVGAQGERNWLLDRAQSDEGASPQLGHVWLDQGTINFVRAPEKTGVRAELQNVRRGDITRLQARVRGQWRGLPLELSAEGDDALKLLAAHTPYSLSLSGEVAGTHVRAEGSVVGLESPEQASLQIEVSGPSLGDWYRIAGIGLPETPPYRTAGHLVLDHGVWRYQDFSSRVGESDLGGEISFEQRKPRPRLTGSLVSRQLRLRDLGPTFGTGPAPAASAPAAGPKRVLPQRHFSAAKWDTLDADVQFDGRTVQDAGPMSFSRLKMHAVLQDRQLTLGDLSLGVAEGQLDGTLAIDGRQEPMAARLDARLSRVQLDDLLPQLKERKVALGLINGRVALNGRGDSYAQLLASSNGQAQLAMGRGTISNLLLELVGLDVAESLKFWISGDRPVNVRCALVDVGVKDGLMDTRTALFDTDDTLIAAGGTLDFRDERLDLTVKPLPKDLSPVALRVPLHVRGTLGDPHVAPEGGKLAARGGGALLLGMLNPLAAIIPLIETGPGHDADCVALVARARHQGVPVQHAAQAASQPSTGRKSGG